MYAGRHTDKRESRHKHIRIKRSGSMKFNLFGELELSGSELVVRFGQSVDCVGQFLNANRTLLVNELPLEKKNQRTSTENKPHEKLGNKIW